MKKRIPLIIGIILIIFSFLSILYPYLSNFINSFFSDTKIENYSMNVDTLDDNQKNEYYAAAKEYNSRLTDKVTNFTYSSESIVGNYNDILNFNDGVIGYIKIPKIDVSLPIYHGSDEDVLSKGAAHIPNTAFPISGKGNHTVISAHTAYPTQIFFDNLKDLTEGDYVYISVLGDTLTYEVCDINIVEPTDIELLQTNKDKDLLSLVTCYPYAVNSHRLIVTAEFVSKSVGNNTATQDTVTIIDNLEPNKFMLIIFTVMIAITIIVVIVVIFKKGCRKNA